MTQRSPDPAAGVQVIARAAEILRTIQSAQGGLTQAEIAERLGLARSTVFRILAALGEEQFVTVTGARGRYRIGSGITRLAVGGRGALIERIHPFLADLSREVQETVDLSVLDHDQVTFIDQVVAPRRLRTVSAVGESFPLYCTAPGKALLSQFTEARLAEALQLPRAALTDTTIIDADELRTELQRVRDAGLAWDREEHHEGISAVGCALRSGDSLPLALSVPMPTQRLTGREDEIAAALLRCCRAVADVLDTL